MNGTLLVCSPSRDRVFETRVRALVREDEWDLHSPEGVALMQSVLRGSYPFATVVPKEVIGLTGPWTLVLEVYRDAASERPLGVIDGGGAAYELHGSEAFDLALRIHGDPIVAAEIVAQVFEDAAISESQGLDAQVLRELILQDTVLSAVEALRDRPSVPDQP